METLEYEKAALRLLSVLIELTGSNRQEIDERLGFSRGYTSRLLTGNCKLLYRHVLSILDTIGISAELYFGVLHGPGRLPRSCRATSAPLPADLEPRIREAAEQVIAELGRPARAPGSRLRKKPERKATFSP